MKGYIFCQWFGKLNVVKINHSQIYIQIKANLNKIPWCFCVCETWQDDSKFMLSFSHSVMSDSLQPHGLQHARLPYPSPTPSLYPNSCPLSQWCHPTISSSVVPFSSCLQSFPASGSFQMSQFLTSGKPSIGVSASASALLMLRKGLWEIKLNIFLNILWLLLPE